MEQSETTCRLRALDHLVLTVADLSETVMFYTQILGMQDHEFTAADGGRRWSLRFGDSKINLHEHGNEFEPKAAHPHPGSADLCFLTGTPLAEWAAHLAEHNVPIEEGPVKRSGALGPITSLYIRDPDRNLIEISVQNA